MGKKIALLILGLALVLGLFTVFQYITGADSGTKKVKVVIENPPTTLPMYWEERDANGHLLYVITAAKAPELLRDDQGHPLPGHFLAEKPLATFYDKSGRIIQVSADLCRAVIDQSPKGSGGLPAIGGKGGGTLTLRGGELEGHVCITITPERGATGADPLAGGVRIHIDDIIELDGVNEVLKTSGGVHLRSDRFDLDGRGLWLGFSAPAPATGRAASPATPKEQRLDLLNIEQGERLILRNVGARTLAFGEGGAGGTRSGATAPATTPAKEAAPPVTYRLTFGQDVRAALGDSKLAGERLYVLFAAAREMLGETRPAAARAGPPAGAAMAATSAVPPALLAPGASEPIKPAGADDLEVTWSGPMEIRPADETDRKLAGPRDVVLEMLGTALKPVTVTDPRFNTESGRLWFHQDEQRLLIEPGEVKKVTLGDPGRGRVECAGVTLDLKANHALLAGPGTLLATSAGASKSTITWKTRMDLDLELAADAKNPSTKTLAIRHAVLDGVTVKAETFDLQADLLDTLIANVTDKGRQVQALEHLLATGHVLVHSYRKGVAGEAGGMQTPRLEIATARTADSAAPVPAQLTAQGEVLAWRYVDKGKGLGGADGPAAAGTGRQKESIAAPKLVADLVPKAGSATAPAVDGGLAGTGQNFDVRRFVASDGARVEIVPPGGSKMGTIVATAGTIDGQPLAGTATLTAAGADPVRLAIGQNAIEGRTIALDNTKRTIRVPGAGVFTFTLPPDKTRPSALPMVVTWQSSMTYEDGTHLAVFTGQPLARVPPLAGAPDQSDQASLKCDKTLTVQLKATAAAATTGAPGSAPASGPALIAGSGLDLDWIQADGNVDARGAQVGPDDKLLTRLRLSGPSLRYRKSENAFLVDGAGALVFEDFRPDKADSQVSTAGESDFNWQGALKFDGQNNTITFAGGVDYFFKPVKPFTITAAPRRAASGPAGPRPPDIVRLHTDQLVATLAASKDAAGKTIESPIGLGAGGNQNLSRVEASGGVQFTAGTYRIANGAMAIEPTWLISGDAMTFDVPTRIGTMTGKEPEGAIAQRVGYGTMTGRSIKFDAAKNDLEVQNWQGNFSNFGG